MRLCPLSFVCGDVADECAAVVVKGKIYAIGGYNGGGNLNSVEVFDPETNKWTPGPEMSTDRSE